MCLVPLSLDFSGGQVALGGYLTESSTAPGTPRVPLAQRAAIDVESPVKSPEYFLPLCRPHGALLVPTAGPGAECTEFRVACAQGFETVALRFSKDWQDKSGQVLEHAAVVRGTCAGDGWVRIDVNPSVAVCSEEPASHERVYSLLLTEWHHSEAVGHAKRFVDPEQFLLENVRLTGQVLLRRSGQASTLLSEAESTVTLRRDRGGLVQASSCTFQHFRAERFQNVEALIAEFCESRLNFKLGLDPDIHAESAFMRSGDDGL